MFNAFRLKYVFRPSDMQAQKVQKIGFIIIDPIFYKSIIISESCQKIQFIFVSFASPAQI